MDWALGLCLLFFILCLFLFVFVFRTKLSGLKLPAINTLCQLYFYIWPIKKKTRKFWPMTQCLKSSDSACMGIMLKLPFLCLCEKQKTLFFPPSDMLNLPIVNTGLAHMGTILWLTPHSYTLSHLRFNSSPLVLLWPLWRPARQRCLLPCVMP